MIIRDALEEEIPFIREQRVIAYSEHANAITSEHWQALKHAISSDADVQEGVELIVAVLDKKVVGSIALFPPKSDAYEGIVEKLDYAEIRLLAVSSQARGKGVASALISECIKRTKEKGIDTIGLHTADFMKNAMELYKKFEFKRIPQFDFEPANDGVVVKAFQKKIG